MNTKVKTMQEAAIEVLVITYPAVLTLNQIEKLAQLAGADMDSRNCGGYWDLLFIHAGLIEAQGWIKSEMGYKLTANGWDMLTDNGQDQ